MFRRTPMLMEGAGSEGGGGGAGAPAGPGAGAPAPGPSPAPSPAPAPAGGDSLLQRPPAPPAPGPAPAPSVGDELAWLPTKFRVNGADGKLDMGASSKKLGESYVALEKMRGGVPAKASDYIFALPEAMKAQYPNELKLDDALSQAFRERCHKAGMSQEQYQFAMEEYLTMVPQVFDAAAKLSAKECREALSKVWTSEADFTAGIQDAQRAVNGAGEISESLWTKFGRDPDFIRFAASMGKEMREDTSANTLSAGGGAGTSPEVQALMASDAYRNPKNPEHAVVSAKVRAYFERTAGTQPAM